MTDLVFAQPKWFWGLLVLVPLLGLRIWSHVRGRGDLVGLVSPRLMKQLVSGRGQSQRWTVFLLQSAVLALTFAALARPQLGFDEIDTQTEARNLIVAIDTSRSMLASDLRPNRLERAKLAATDIIRSLPEDRVGLIAFAGRPFLQAPLTVDHEAILEAIDQMDTEIIPRGGTNIASAAELALETFEEAKLEQSALVLFSDGEALEGTEQVERIRERARKSGMSIIAVGVGTLSGSIIPELDNRGEPIPGQFIMDDEGQVVRSRLDPKALQTLASGGGVYVHLGGQSSLNRVVEQIQREIATSRAESESRRRPKERFMWPLSAAIGFLLLAHVVPLLWMRPAKRDQKGLATLSSSAATGLAFLILLPSLFPQMLSANEDPLFLGHEAFREGNYEKAIETYESALSEKVSPRDESLLQLALGAAAFRQGDYERASEAYGQALVGSQESFQEHAHYNLGNTLFRKGESALQSTQQTDPDQPAPSLPPGEIIDATLQQWESALEHYESALALNEENQKAAHNIEVVKKKIEDLKKQQEEQQEQEEQEKEEEEKQEEEEKEDEEENQDDSGDSEENEESESDPQGSSDDQEGDGDSENSPEDSEENEEPQDPESEENQNPEDSDENQDPEDSEEKDPGKEEEDSERPEDGEDPNEPEPREGQLEANPNQQQPPQQANVADPAQREVNPETGYSPSEARQLLEALADETEVRPILAPSRGEIYKNW